MKTKKIIIFSALIGMLLSGCYVSSIHPLYTKKDRIFLPEIEGKWISNDKETYLFEKTKDDTLSYKLTHIEKRQEGEVNPGSDTAIMEANFVRLGNEIFMDLTVGDNSHIKGFGFMLNLHIMKVHSFSKIKFLDGNPQIHFMKEKWLEDIIKNNRIRIKHEVIEDDKIVLTASTKELQKFMTKYADEEQAYDDPIILTAFE